jgi:hypothetical protein
MEKRRQFIKRSLNVAIFAAVSNDVLSKIYGSQKRTLPYDVDNPYDGVNWDRFQQIASASHVHITDQEKLDKMYNQFKLRHIPISNYYPSAPYYPADQIRQNQFMVSQNFDLMYNPDISKKGKDRWLSASAIKGPSDWNAILMDEKKGWYTSLPEEQKKQLPFKVGERVFKQIPKDVIISPNAEHHSFTNSSLHSNAIGSLYSSGTFDARNRFGTFDHGYCYGTGLPWQQVFEKMIKGFLFADAGGITINHPVWSSLSFDEICQMLDFDKRVLGIEVFNDTCYTAFGDPDKGWALKLWDQVLRTKRKCFGFFVPDHTAGKGRNILLVPQFNEYECLKAYRKGAFFGALDGSGLAFTRIQIDQDRLSVGINKPGSIRVVTDIGEPKVYDGNLMEYVLPKDGAGIPQISYIRIEASDETSEQIFSQPILFKPLAR